MCTWQKVSLQPGSAPKASACRDGPARAWTRDPGRASSLGGVVKLGFMEEKVSGGRGQSAGRRWLHRDSRTQRFSLDSLAISESRHPQPGGDCLKDSRNNLSDQPMLGIGLSPTVRVPVLVHPRSLGGVGFTSPGGQNSSGSKPPGCPPPANVKSKTQKDPAVSRGELSNPVLLQEYLKQKEYCGVFFNIHK